MRPLGQDIRLGIRAVTACFAVGLSGVACSENLPSHYSAEAIEARVVDAETQKPLEDVIVTANWQLVAGLEGSTPVGQMELFETVTDKAGKFSFPAWGPKKRTHGFLRNRDPQLLFFKSGYKPQILTNTVLSKPNMNSVRISEWNGRTIELNRFRGTLSEYEKLLSILDTSIRGIAVYGKSCEWKKMPKMLSAILRQEKVFQNAKVFNSLMQVGSLPPNGCGSPKDYFGANSQ